MLVSHPLKHRRSEEAVLAQLGELERDQAEEVVEASLRHVPEGLKSYRDLAGELGLGQERLSALVQELETVGRAVRLQVENQACAVHIETWEMLGRRINEALASFHTANPLRKGLNREELRNLSAPYVQPELFDQVMQSLAREGHIGMDGSMVHAETHSIRFTPEEGKLKERIEAALKGADLPDMPDAEGLAQLLPAERRQVDALLRALRSLGTVVFLEGGLLLHADTLEEVREKLSLHLSGEGEITVAGFRDLIAGNRKYALALLTYFDREGFTERRGDVRVLKD